MGTEITRGPDPPPRKAMGASQSLVLAMSPALRLIYNVVTESNLNSIFSYILQAHQCAKLVSHRRGDEPIADIPTRDLYIFTSYYK